jgi:predicted alpha/beta-fold hydrolase
VHGLCSDGDSLHNRRIALKLLSQGMVVIRFNHRGANRFLMPYAKQLYHGGRFDDLYAMIKQVATNWSQVPVMAIGFSLSANMLLAMAGHYRESLRMLENFRGIMAICPPVDVGSSSRALARWPNLFFDQYFAMRLKRILRQHRRVHSLNPRSVKIPVWCSVRRFDVRYTKQVLGMDTVDQYYDLCSAARVYADIETPSYIVAAKDDPIVPVSTIEALSPNEHVKINIEKGGGHLGFISSRRTPLGDRYWLDYLILQWIAGTIAAKTQPSRILDRIA